MEGCEVAHVGHYGLWFRRGCKDNRIAMPAVRPGRRRNPHRRGRQGPTDEAESSRNSSTTTTSSTAATCCGRGGHLGGPKQPQTISHNEIHDFFYSGMSIGWNWDDAPNRCHHNASSSTTFTTWSRRAQRCGPIYRLGASPGSVIRNNMFHDVWPYQNPPFGWGIYLDATCSGYLVENNVVYNTLSGGLMYNNGGHEHVIQNNIFADSANHAFWPYWEKRPNIFRHNIVYLTQGDLMIPFGERSLRERLANKDRSGVWDDNLYWYTGGAEHCVSFASVSPNGSRWGSIGSRGLPIHGLSMRPARIPSEGRLSGPATGFQPFDMSRAGLYGKPRGSTSVATGIARTLLCLRPLRRRSPSRWTMASKTRRSARIRPTPRSAEKRRGPRSASAMSVPPRESGASRSPTRTLLPAWQPHFYYEPHITEGVVRQSFDAWLKPGVEFFTSGETRPIIRGTSGPASASPAAEASSSAARRSPRSRAGSGSTSTSRDAWATTRRGSLPWLPGLGRPPQVFDKLAFFPGNEFRELHWLGFSSTALADTVFYLDNMKISRRPVAACTRTMIWRNSLSG